jgi:hypothetical protein
MLFKPERFPQSDCFNNRRKLRDIHVPVTYEFQQSLNAAFPTIPRGIQINTAENNKDIQCYIALLIHEAMNDKHDWFEVNTDLLGAMTNGTRRDEIMKFIRESGYFQLVRPAIEGMWCNAYALNKTVNKVGQHNGSCSSAPPLPSVLLPSPFRHRFDTCFRSASDRLWRGSQEYMRNAVAGLERLVLLNVPEGFAEYVARLRMEKKGPKRNAKNGKFMTFEELVSLYLKKFSEFCEDPMEGLKRRSTGRMYSRMANLQKLFRMHLLRVKTSRGEELSVELDMSSTNPVCLGKILLDEFGPRSTVMKYIGDSCTGEIYGKVCSEAGGKFATMERDEQKRQFQIHCFFDKKERFGLSPVFKASARLYPEAAEYLRSVRGMEFGAAFLSARFSRIEARFFIDLVTPALVKNGMPPSNVHDAVKVAESEQEESLKTMNRLAVDYFGFLPRIKPTPPPTICIN